MEDQSCFENNSSSVLLEKKGLKEEGILFISATCFIICASFFTLKERHKRKHVWMLKRVKE
jgi:hypothetical protein